MIYPVHSFRCSNGFFFICDEEVIFLALHFFMKRETYATKGRAMKETEKNDRSMT